MNRVEKQPVDSQARQARIWGTILRILGGVLIVAFGALPAIWAVAIVWFAVAPVVAPPGSVLYSYGIEIGGVTLKGWEIFACAGLFLVVGIGLILFGLSLLVRRKGSE